MEQQIFAVNQEPDISMPVINERAEEERKEIIEMP